MHLSRLLPAILVSATLAVFAQTNSDEIARLKALLTTSEERARQAEKIANEYKLMAERERNESDRRRNIAIAYAVAEKSKEIEDNELRALLALQAHDLNKKNNGYVHSSKVFEGLIGALDSKNGVNNFTVKADDENVAVGSRGIYFISTENRLVRKTKNREAWEEHVLLDFKKNLAKSITLSPDEHFLAIVFNNHSNTHTKFIYIYDIENINAEPTKIENVEGKVEKLIVADDGTTFFTATDNGRSSSFHLAPGNSTLKFLGMGSIFDFNYKTKQLLTITGTGKLKLLNVQNNTSDSVSIQDNEKVTAVRFFPKQFGFVIGFNDGSIRIFSAFKTNQAITLENQRSSVLTIAFANNGELLAVANADNSVRIWNVRNFREHPMTITSQFGEIKKIEFSNTDYKLIGTISVNGSNSKGSSTKITYWPVDMDSMANTLCESLTRNLSVDEWAIYLGDIPYEPACLLTSRQ